MRGALAVLLGIGAIACGGEEPSSSPDAGVDSALDATLPPHVDAGADARSSTPDAPPDVRPDAPPPIDAGLAVTQHHNHGSRDGLYVTPRLTREAAKSIHRDPAFHGVVRGDVHAQPLYVEHGPAGAPAFYVVTLSNSVHALDARTRAARWERTLGTPVALGELACGIFDTVGIAGTPIIDLATRALVFDAMITPDGGATKQHLVHALSLDDGHTLDGWPVDVAADVKSG